MVRKVTNLSGVSIERRSTNESLAWHRQAQENNHCIKDSRSVELCSANESLTWHRQAQENYPVVARIVDLASTSPGESPSRRPTMTTWHEESEWKMKQRQLGMVGKVTDLSDQYIRNSKCMVGKVTNLLSHLITTWHGRESNHSSRPVYEK